MFVRWQPHNWAEARTLLSAGGAGGEGGGGGGNEGRQKERASDLVDRYNGDAVKMAEKLADALNDNYTLRRKRDDLQGEVTTLTGNQKPEGATILTGDEAKAYDAYKALGKPDELTQRLTAGDEASGKVKTLERDSVLRSAAEVSRFNFDVLKDRAGDLPVAIEDVTEDGKTAKRAFVTPEGGAKTPLTEYAEAQWPVYLPALRVAESGEGQRQSGVSFPKQGAGGGAPAAQGAASSFIANKYGPRK